MYSAAEKAGKEAYLHVWRKRSLAALKFKLSPENQKFKCDIQNIRTIGGAGSVSPAFKIKIDKNHHREINDTSHFPSVNKERGNCILLCGCCEGK